MRTLLTIVFTSVCCASAGGAAPAALEAEREQLWSSYRQRLTDLAERASAARDAAAADLIASWLPQAEPNQLILFDPSTALAPSLEGDFSEPFAELRGEQAEALFALARRSAEEGAAALALRLAAEAVRENPDHAAARRVLGFEHVDGVWISAHEARMYRAGNVWHDAFGWIKKSDVAKYESGRRSYGRQWISAQEDAALHRSIDKGWVIATEHFLVRTNHSLEQGAALARRLESLHAVWRQLFADAWLSPSDLSGVIAGRRSLPRRARPHQVWYFRDREEYNAALRREQPRIDITLGIYFDDHRRGYFFAGDSQHPSTIVHEAVHQLFQESGRTARLVGRANNVWIVEGIATYFESLCEHSDPAAGTYYTLGGADAGRFPTARARWLQENYYVPLAELVRLGKDDLQQRPDLMQLYSQLAGLATFLMHFENGRYRQPLNQYLSAVYSGRATDRSLAEITGQSYEQLDQQYETFLRGAAGK